MKKQILIALLLSSGLVLAEDPWMTDLDAAREIAQKENKQILINFSGSDWCGWCKRLNREVFTRPDFHAWAKDNLVLVNLDYPKFTKQDPQVRAANMAWMRRYRVAHFPTVIVADAQGRAILRTGYQSGGPEAYIKHLTSRVEQLN